MKNFNIVVFVLATIAFCFLLIPSFIAAWAEDEGTLGTNIIGMGFAKLFNILRFPTHVIAWPMILKGGSEVYFISLFVNCIFYGFVTERIINIFKKRT